MGIYFEAGVGKATAGSSLEMGRSAAKEGISQLEKFEPVLALVLVCSELDIGAANQELTDPLRLPDHWHRQGWEKFPTGLLGAELY